MGCTPALCAESQQQLSQASESLAERMECFLSWYRCSGDSTSPKVCDERERRIPEWCNIYAADWRTMAASAPAFGEFNDKEITSAEPLELRSDTRRGRPIPPFGLWVLTVVAFMSGCFAVYRAALWLSDEYLASREFDPYLINQLAFYPLYILVAFGLVPILVAFNAAFLAPIFYHRALQLQCNHSSKIGGWHNLQVGAAAEFNRLQAQMTWAGNVGLGSAVSVMALLSYATIGMSHKSNFDRGQIAAAVAFILAWGSIIGGAGNWIAESSPLVHDQMDSREKHFEVAVLSICGTGLLTMLASVVLLAFAAMLVTLMFSGIGPILHHFLHYTWMQWTSWYDPRTFKPLLGKWYTWILHIRDLHLLHGFRVLLDGQLREDGFVRIDFYMSNDSYNTVSTRTVPVRAFTQKNMNPFEGDNICLNVLNWRSIMWIDVMYQSTPGAHARRVAGAVWDPWTGSLLQKCFWNVKICEPHIGTDRAFPGQQVKLWEFEDLIDADGMPKNGHYVEQRVNLMPNGGLLSLQMTHLGPRQVLEERDDPSDQPSVELFLGDTIASSAGVGFARRAHKHHETPTSPSGSIVGLVSKVSGYWTVDKGGIGGVELEMHHEMPKRYGWNNGKHQWAELEPSEWIVAVHQQQQEKYPNHYGKALAFFTSTGKIRQFAVPSAMKLNHLAAPRGFQIRKLVFSGPRLQSIQVNPVDGKGFEKVNWYVDEEPLSSKMGRIMENPKILTMVTKVLFKRLRRSVAFSVVDARRFTYAPRNGMDGVFAPRATQDEVFDQVGWPVLKECLTGYNGTILAYGQLLGPSLVLVDGVTVCFFGVPVKHQARQRLRCCAKDWKREDDAIRNDTRSVYEVDASAMQIYNEQAQTKQLAIANQVDDLLVEQEGHLGGTGRSLALAEGPSSWDPLRMKMRFR
ncbi:unnamed protein product [Durusdinium trenchii]|uniref:Kinesin motor domain-containing protein n=1 Tax=Durusdinium trenchii TaxID=1381693 RepID=A0ABP0S2T5_9DINO